MQPGERRGWLVCARLCRLLHVAFLSKLCSQTNLPEGRCSGTGEAREEQRAETAIAQCVNRAWGHTEWKIAALVARENEGN